MHWLDLTLLALLAVGAGLGFWSGFILQIARLFCFGLSIAATLLLNEPVTRLLHDRVAPEANVNLLRGVAYLAVFLVVYITLFSLSRLVYKAVRDSKLEILDRVAGAGLGALKMTLILAPACALLAFLALPTTERWMRESAVAPVLAKEMDLALRLVPDGYRNQAQESVEHVRDRLKNEAVGKAFEMLQIEEALNKN
jgi:uncharacterized membrane protein required for colicin V production